jgi:cytochrome P450
MSATVTDRGKAIPFVRGFPVVGTLPYLSRDALGFLSRLRDEHGDVVRVNLRGRTAVAVADPAMIEYVLVENPGNYSKQTRAYNAMRKVLGNGLITSEGDFWLRQRRIAQPAFHRERIAGFADTIRAAAVDTVARWPNAGLIDMTTEMTRLTMRIVGETLLSSDVSHNADAVGDAVSELLRQAMKRTRALWVPPPSVPTPMNLRLKRATRRLNDTIYAVIRERRVGKAKPDLLSMLMDSVDEETGSGMNDEQLRDEVMTIFLAGHETTANLLAWTHWLLVQHSHEEDRLREEIAMVVADEPVSLAHLRQMPFLDAVLKESLRLYPPVWSLSRRVETDETVHGWRLHKGEFVLISQWVVHRHPRLWDKASTFSPQRFIDEPEPKQRYAYFPFSGGHRKCLGDQFAVMEAKIVLVETLKRVRLRLAKGARIVPEPVITLRPAHGMPMMVTGKNVVRVTR